MCTLVCNGCLYGCVCLCVPVRGLCVWLCEPLCGCVWLCVAVRGLSVAVCGDARDQQVSSLWQAKGPQGTHHGVGLFPT